MSRGEARPAPGRPLRPAAAALLHPATLAAMAVLAVNDHVLKAAWPGVVTGKLSDLAGLAFFPLLPVVAAELSGWIRRPVWAVAWSAAATGAAFAAIKLTAAGADAYRALGGLAQWPAHAVVALATGAPLPSVEPVAVARDPWDLLALAALLVPVALVRAAARAAASPAA